MAPSILQPLTSNPKRLFLIDGIGAVVSAIFLGVVLVQVEVYIGMPKTVLYVLASLACLYAIYSLSCSFFLPANWRPFLKGIALANLLHCGLTLGLVIYFYQKLTVLGITYFLLEMMIVVGLVVLERMAYSEISL